MLKKLRLSREPKVSVNFLIVILIFQMQMWYNFDFYVIDFSIT